MFQSITYEIISSTYSLGKRQCLFSIIDSNFEKSFELEMPVQLCSMVNRIYAVIMTYSKRNISPIKPICMLYEQHEGANNFPTPFNILYDKRQLQEYYPEIRYEQNYLPCVIRYLKRTQNKHYLRVK